MLKAVQAGTPAKDEAPVVTSGACHLVILKRQALASLEPPRVKHPTGVVLSPSNLGRRKAS